MTESKICNASAPELIEGAVTMVWEEVKHETIV